MAFNGNPALERTIVTWLGLELLGLLFFFSTHTWADVTELVCSFMDPDREVYVDCDPDYEGPVE